MGSVDTVPGELIRSRLAALRRKRLANDLLALGLLGVGMLSAAVALVALAFWSGWLLLLLLPGFGLVAWRWLRGFRRRQLAYAVEAQFPVVAGRLVAALDLSDQTVTREGYSAELQQAAVRAVEADLRALALDRVCRRRRILHAGLAAIFGIGLLAAGRLTLPQRLEVGFVNAFARDRLRVAFHISPGDTAVLPGTELELSCRVEPAGVFRAVALEQPGRQTRRLPLDDGVARVPFYAAREQRYRFRVLGAVSPEHRVRVLEPLAIEELSYTCRYPAYSGLPERKEAGPELVALVGSEFLIEGRANQQFETGRLVFPTDTIPLAARPDETFSGGFAVRGDDRGVFELQGEEGAAYQQCGLVSVRAVPDEFPLARVLRPGRDVDLPMSMQLPLLINTLDDYGLGVLWLRWGRDSLDTRVRVKTLAGRREDTTLYVWDLSGLDLLPGEVVRYRVEVTDNDNVSGPKTGRTEVFQVRFPTMTEIFGASVRQVEQTRDELEPLRDLQERLTEEVGRLGEQARGAGELSWEERQALGNLLSEQQDLADELAQLHEQVSALLDEAYDGVAFDQETVKRLAELQQLLAELLPRELAESLDRLREKLGESSQEMRAALEQFELDQEEFRSSLDAALEFLQQVMDEQRLEALARTAQELARTEEEISERALSEPVEALAREQDALAAALDSLLADLAGLAEQISDSGAAEALTGLAEDAEQDGLSETAHDAAGSFREGQSQAGQQQASQVAGELGELGESLSGLSSSLKKKRSSEVAGRLLSAAEELLMLSREQEALVGQLVPGEETGPSIARGMALHDATGVIAESLAALSGRTMAVPGRLVGELGRARQLMKAAGQDLLEARAGRAAGQMVQARAALDRVAAGLLEAVSGAEQGGGMSGGFEGLMEALSQMAAGQMAVNVGMGGMPIPVPGGMSPGMAEALGRLLSQQGAVRERLEQLLEELGGQRPGLTSALDGMVEEMKAVERDMAELNIQRELIERQEGILSRLLDAQRSVRQRGQKEEREGETARTFERETVPVLPEDRGERNRLLREELMRALREGRLGRFEAQVRAYFERLLQEP
ncbi:MAG: DUF4175 family protein [bacterium]